MATDTCTTCGKPTDPHPYRHPITTMSGNNDTSWLVKKPEKASERPADVPAQILPFDPVLRQALINKGVLTPEDIARAKAQIDAINGGLYGAASSEPRSR